MFERFTADARAVVVTAQEEARRLGHKYIGTEHVLAALLSDADGPVARALAGDGVDAAFVRGDIARRVGPHPPDLTGPPADRDREDAEALKAIGIDLDQVRRAIEATFGAGALHLTREGASRKKGLFGRFSGGGGHIPFTNRNKKVLELSLREALRLDQKFIAPEHIMLGLLREGEGLAAQILHEKGVDFARLRADMTTALRARAS
jgi:ATP-dependent Clp protease ATP-binding subunit ClpA